MKRLVSVLLPLIIFSAFILFSGCGDNKISKINPPPPIGSIVVTPESVTLAASETQQFTATVTGTTDKSVNWTVSECSGANCGTITATGLYTAPAFIPDWRVVTVTAALKSDSRISAVAGVQHRPVTVDIGEDVTLGAGEIHQFYASVSGHANTTVTWSLSGCTGESCGILTSQGLYTAPDSLSGGTSARVTATSQADPTKSSTVTVHHVPVIVSVSPITARIAPGGSITLNADVQHDCLSSGVTWSLDPNCTEGNCGALSNVLQTSVVYTAPSGVPSPPTVILTATSVRDPNRKAKIPIMVGSAPALKEGDYVFFFHGWEGSIVGGVEMIVGRFHADGAGNITGGVRDVNTPWTFSLAESFSGSYSLGPDSRGTLSLGDASYSLKVEESGTRGQFAQASMYAQDSGTGYFELQDTEALSPSSVSGPYGLRLFGRLDTGSPIAAAGRFAIADDGTLSSGRMDMTALTGLPHGYANLAVTGSFGAPSAATGRGTGSITLAPKPDIADGTYNFAYYVVSKDKVVLVQIDQQNSPTIPTFGGEMRRQSGAFSLESLGAPIIFTLSGDSWFGSTLALGRMVPDGKGTMTGSIDLYDSSLTDEPAVLDAELSGTYSVDADGRAAVSIQVPSRGTVHGIAYLYGPNEGFLLSTAESAQAAIGEFEPQTGGPFSAASVRGAYGVGSVPDRTASWEGAYVEVMTLDGVDTISASALVSWIFGVSEEQSIGNYSAREDGRGTVTWVLPPPEDSTVFWIVSPGKMVGVSSSVYSPVLIKYTR